MLESSSEHVYRFSLESTNTMAEEKQPYGALIHTDGKSSHNCIFTSTQLFRVIKKLCILLISKQVLVTFTLQAENSHWALQWEALTCCSWQRAAGLQILWIDSAPQAA